MRARCTPEVREAVLARDGRRCVAPAIAKELGEGIDLCLTKWGQPMTLPNGYYREDELQVDRVRDEPGAPPVYRLEGAQALCPHHHLDGWATKKEHRAAARERLARLHAEEVAA